MKDKIDTILPDHIITCNSSKELFIVDYKNLNGGEVTLHETKPDGIESVYLANENEVGIYFDGFKENALPIAPGNHNSQCECVLFPEACNESDWILFIETKYTNDIVSAFNENHDYPNCMVDQIISTVKYFRDKGIIGETRRVNAIVSFPRLIEEFNGTFFTGERTIEDILKNHNIRIRATNSALIKSEKRITLNPI